MGEIRRFNNSKISEISFSCKGLDVLDINVFAVSLSNYHSKNVPDMDLTQFRMDLYRATHGWVRGFFCTPLLKYVTYILQ